MVQYLYAVVMYKYSMSCDMFEFLYGPLDVQFGLSFGFWVGLGITLVLHLRVTLAVAVNYAIYAVWLGFVL